MNSRDSRRAISVASVPLPVNRTRSADGTSLLDELAPLDFEVVARAGVRALRHLLLHGLHHVVGAVAEDVRAVADEVVGELVAVHVPLVRALRVGDVDRERVHHPRVVRDAAGEELLRLLEPLLRPGERGGVAIGERLAWQSRACRAGSRSEGSGVVS